MLSPIRAVIPRTQSRCPECHCFVRLDAGTCTACGVAFALVAGTRRAETRLLEVQGVAFQNGPKGNALSNLQPDGKIKKTKKPENSLHCQYELFSFDDLPRCYDCDQLVKWLAPDGRCKDCTRLTENEVL